MFLKETKRIQEKMKGMKSFADIIDATNQALDEFNAAFEEAGRVLEKRRKELAALIDRAEKTLKRLEESGSPAKAQPAEEDLFGLQRLSSEPATPSDAAASDEDRVDAIKRFLSEGRSHEEISRITGASIREVRLVEKFAGGR
jgi:hypothetical protein